MESLLPSPQLSSKHNDFYLGQSWRDTLAQLDGVMPTRQEFNDMCAEDKLFISTLIGLLQDCRRSNLYDEDRWQEIGRRLFGLITLAGSLPSYKTLDSKKTFPSVAGWVYVKGDLREDRLLNCLSSWAQLFLLHATAAPTTQRLLHNVGQVLAQISVEK